MVGDKAIEKLLSCPRLPQGGSLRPSRSNRQYLPTHLQGDNQYRPAIPPQKWARTPSVQSIGNSGCEHVRAPYASLFGSRSISAEGGATSFEVPTPSYRPYLMRAPAWLSTRPMIERSANSTALSLWDPRLRTRGGKRLCLVLSFLTCRSDCWWCSDVGWTARGVRVLSANLGGFLDSTPILTGSAAIFRQGDCELVAVGVEIRESTWWVTALRPFHQTFGFTF